MRLETRKKKYLHVTDLSIVQKCIFFLALLAEGSAMSISHQFRNLKEKEEKLHLHDWSTSHR